MSITNYIKDCTKNVAGNNDKLYVAAYEDIAGVTFSGTTFTDISMDSGKKFALLMADLDAVQYTSSGTAGRSYYSEQNLIARFSKKSPELETTVNDLIDQATCGLVVIRIDGNNNGWISGISPLDESIANRPYLSLTEEFDSGASIEDEEGNAYSLTFTRMSATREYDVASAVVTALLGRTAAFVDWTGYTPPA